MASHSIYDALTSPRYCSDLIYHDLTSNVARMVLSTSGEIIASLHGNQIEIRVIEGGCAKKTITSEDCSHISDLAWRPGHQHVVTCGFDEKLRVWDIETGTSVVTLTEESTGVYCVSAHPHGNLIACGAYDRHVRIWDVRADKPIIRKQGAHALGITSVDFSPSGDQLLSTGLDSYCTVWNLNCELFLNKFSAGPGINPVSLGRFFDEKSVVTSEQYELKLWNSEMGEVKKVFKGHSSGLSNLYSSFAIADKKWLLMGSEDHKIYVWNLSTGEKVQVFYAHNNAVIQVVAHANNNIVASSSMGNDKTIRLWKRSLVNEALDLSF